MLTTGQQSASASFSIAPADSFDISFCVVQQIKKETAWILQHLEASLLEAVDHRSLEGEAEGDGGSGAVGGNVGHTSLDDDIDEW